MTSNFTMLQLTTAHVLPSPDHSDTAVAGSVGLLSSTLASSKCAWLRQTVSAVEVLVQTTHQFSLGAMTRRGMTRFIRGIWLAKWGVVPVSGGTSPLTASSTTSTLALWRISLGRGWKTCWSTELSAPLCRLRTPFETVCNILSYRNLSAGPWLLAAQCRSKIPHLGCHCIGEENAGTVQTRGLNCIVDNCTLLLDSYEMK